MNNQNASLLIRVWKGDFLWGPQNNTALQRKELVEGYLLQKNVTWDIITIKRNGILWACTMSAKVKRLQDIKHHCLCETACNNWRHWLQESIVSLGKSWCVVGWIPMKYSSGRRELPCPLSSPATSWSPQNAAPGEQGALRNGRTKGLQWGNYIFSLDSTSPTCYKNITAIFTSWSWLFF